MLNSSCRIYLIPKDPKYRAVFLSIKNGTQCVPLFFLSLGFITYAPSFILGKLFYDKNLDSQLKYLIISILLKGWGITKKNYPCILFLLF